MFRPQTCPNIWKCTFAGIDEIIYRYWRNCIPYWGNHILVFTKNVPSQTFWNHILMLTKLLTSSDEILYQYWRNCILALTKWYIGIDEIHSILVLAKSYTGVGKGQLISLAYYFINTHIGFGQYRYTILSILLYDFVNTVIWFCQYRYTILSISVYNFIYMYALPSFWIPIYDIVNTSIQFGEYQYTISSEPVYDIVKPVYNIANTCIWFC